VNGSWTPERLVEAAGELCNGTLVEQDGAALDELLQRDPVARRIYTDYMCLHASLYAENSSYAGLHATEHALAPESPASELALTRSHSWVDDPAAMPNRRRSWRPQMLAVALAGVVALLGWGGYELATRTPGVAGQQVATADPKAEVAAQISGTHNCR